MITVGGREYGTAAEIADLWPEVTAKKVRDWATRAADPADPLYGMLDRLNLPGRGRGTTYFRVDQAAIVERITRTATRGRRRRLDTSALVA